MWGIFMQNVPILPLFSRLRTKLVWCSTRPVQQVRTAFIGEMFADTAEAGLNNEYVFYLILVVEAQTEVVESWNENNPVDMQKKILVFWSMKFVSFMFCMIKRSWYGHKQI